MPPGPSRSPLSVGITWAYRISALGLEFVLPTLAGYALDRRWGTAPIATIAGACIGFVLGMVHLIQLSSAARSDDPRG